MAEQLLVATVRSARTDAKRVTEQVEYNTTVVLRREEQGRHIVEVCRQVRGERQSHALDAVDLSDAKAIFGALAVFRQEVKALGDLVADITIIA